MFGHSCANLCTKFIVTDEDINIRNWEDVIWAITTRMDPTRDTVMIDNTPIDYLDFASPVSGLAQKWVWTRLIKCLAKPITNGRAQQMSTDVKRVDELWRELGINIRPALDYLILIIRYFTCIA